MLEFNTPTGNMYAWDNKIGLFIPMTPVMKAVMEEVSSQSSISKDELVTNLRDSFNEGDIIFCYSWIRKWTKLMPQSSNSLIPQELCTLDIKGHLLKRGLVQLTLCVTEDCNFRCKYCVYSDYYEYERSYSNRYMNFVIAKKAIDYYFSLLKEGKKYNPLRKPAVGFYGGEPLLNFKLIKECVNYIQENYGSNIYYLITTNGSLLDEERSNWLMDNDFVISVSLDGPEQEHNRLRVYGTGKGTFKDVMKNVGRLMESGYKKINCQPVYDWKSDIFSQEEFFYGKHIPPVIRASLVSRSEGCRYYEQFNREDYLDYLAKLERATAYYFENIEHCRQKEKPSFFDKVIGERSGHDLFGSGAVLLPNPIMPFTRACIPGTKLFVDVTGEYYACEKLNNAFPIGNVDTGLNFSDISKIIGNYISHMDKCPSCEISRNCINCYQVFTTDKKFLCSSEVCKNMESLKRKSFAKILALAELRPEFIEKSYSKHKNIKKYYG
ncbi:MAG: radical SAM protein [Methanotrichaceae archaeon]